MRRYFFNYSTGLFCVDAFLSINSGMYFRVYISVHGVGKKNRNLLRIFSVKVLIYFGFDGSISNYIDLVELPFRLNGRRAEFKSSGRRSRPHYDLCELVDACRLYVHRNRNYTSLSNH